MSKKQNANSGLRKNHGPKRHQFADYGKTMSIELSKAGITNKYFDKESWKMSCLDRGCKNVTDVQWDEFSRLKTVEDKKAWLSKLSKR